MTSPRERPWVHPVEGLQDGSTQGPSDLLFCPQGCASGSYWGLALLVMSVSFSHLFPLTMPCIPHTLPQAELLAVEVPGAVMATLFPTP